MVEMVNESAALLSKMPTLEKYGTNLAKLAKEVTCVQYRSDFNF